MPKNNNLKRLLNKTVGARWHPGTIWMRKKNPAFFQARNINKGRDLTSPVPDLFQVPENPAVALPWPRSGGLEVRASTELSFCAEHWEQKKAAHIDLNSASVQCD